MALRESTFITPREGDQDVMKKAHIFTGPLLRLLENFDVTPLQVFKIFIAPPPPSRIWNRRSTIRNSLLS